MTNRIQVALVDRREAEDLRRVLLTTCGLNIEVVDQPDPAHEGVLVVDCARLSSAPDCLAHPDRVVVLADRGDEAGMSRAWNAGVKTVLFHDDSTSTIVLAVMAAQLHARTHFDKPARGGQSVN
ncbi:MAG: hypothetical protein NTV70_25770 [Acidobacteria bacterium]|nr:hypothetical protein [Acidobacteriota bacterium]